MKLVLIRHGQTPSNVLGLLDTAVPGPGLTDLGIAQAAAIPAALAGLDVSAIYASTQPRAQLTARPLAAARGLDLRIRDGLREIAAGDLEMRGDDEAIRIYLGTVFGWLEGDIERRMPGGENAIEALTRFDAVVQEAAGAVVQDGTAVLVSHGAAIRLWASARSVNLEATFGAVHGLGNTGVVELVGDPDQGWRALRWSGVALGGPRLDDAPESGPTADTVGPHQH